MASRGRRADRRERLLPAVRRGRLRAGRAFHGLRAAWRHGGDTYAEVALPQPHHHDATRFGIHPALLDAALHAGGLTALAQGTDAVRGRVPFTWSGVRLYATGATALRVRLTRTRPATARLSR
ncbi:polyketide synthase dehydratase domain-containing protein [Micromonospora sp. M12]